MTRQNNTQRGTRGRGRGGGYGGRGRGRGGRGRYGNKRRYNKKRYNDEPVEKKAPIERCPFIVGTPEWCAWKKARYTPSSVYVGEPIDPKFIPRTYKMNTDSDDVDKRMADLQQQMIDNNWQLSEDENGIEYFKFARYLGKRVDVHTHISRDGRVFKLPLMDREEDPEGVGCCFNYQAPSLTYTIEPNAYIEYTDTRVGRRRENYLKYLAHRLKRKAQFQEEAAAIAAAAVINKRQTNKVISTV